MAKKSSPKADYEDIGKMLQSIYESGYIDHKRAYKLSFIKGIFAGLGGVIGATVVVGLLLWLLSVLHYVPFINQITDNVQCTIQQSDTEIQTNKRCDN